MSRNDDANREPRPYIYALEPSSPMLPKIAKVKLLEEYF
jgi:hypothetical protein